MLLGIAIGGWELLLMFIAGIVVLLVVKLGKKSLAVIAGILVLMSLTNPSEADHRAALRDSLDPLDRVIVSAADQLDLLPLRCRSFVVASACSLNGRSLTVGVLKNVVVESR